jgi:hypothetical protein
LAELHNAYQFAFAVIVSGGRFHQIRQLLAFCNLTTTKEWDCYRAKKSIGTGIIERGRECCGDARQRITDSAIIAMDGSWGQRRNAIHWIVDFADPLQSKICGFRDAGQTNRFCPGQLLTPANPIIAITESLFEKFELG